MCSENLASTTEVNVLSHVSNAVNKHHILWHLLTSLWIVILVSVGTGAGASGCLLLTYLACFVADSSFSKKRYNLLAYRAYSSWSVLSEKIFSCPLLIRNVTFSVHLPFLRSAHLNRTRERSKIRAHRRRQMANLTNVNVSGAFYLRGTYEHIAGKISH